VGLKIQSEFTEFPVKRFRSQKLEPSDTKKLAANANGETWKYLAKPHLTEDERVQILCCYDEVYAIEALHPMLPMKKTAKLLMEISHQSRGLVFN
jgi:hypothetical protein